MALTTVNRENFLPASATLAGFNASTDIRATGHLGNFTSVFGTIYCRPFGPSVAGGSDYANGWSGDVRGTTSTDIDGGMPFSDSQTQNFGQWSMWVYFNTYSNDASNKVFLIKCAGNGTNLQLASTGRLYVNNSNTSTLYDTGYTPPQYVWVWLAIQYVKSGSNFTRRLVSKLIGGNLTVQWTEPSPTATSGSAPFNVRFGSTSTGGTAGANFRMGACELANFTQSDFSDATYPADLIEPPSTRPTWYIRSDGSDNNAGVTPGTAWGTVAKVVTESQNATGMLPLSAGSIQSVSSITVASGVATVSLTAHGFSTGRMVAIAGASPGWVNQGASITVVDANTFVYSITAPPIQGTGSLTATGTVTAQGAALGDTLIVDSNTTGTPIDFGTSSLNDYCRGLSVRLVGSPVLHRTIPNAGWAVSAGSTKTYQLADGSDIGSVVIWENDQWLNHPTGANFAAVQASMDSTPGSFFSDGTNLYLHPFGDTNPNSDGKTYARSRNRGSGASAIRINASDVQVFGDATYPCVLKKTCMAQSADNDPLNAYLVQWGADGGAGGFSRLANLTLDYGSKHFAGSTGQRINSIAVYDTVTYGQGSPYVATGGQTQAVDFNANSSDSGNRYIYMNCGSSVNAGVIGSSAGKKNIAYPSWLTHGVSGTPFTGGWHNNCNWCSGLQEQNVTTGTIAVSGGTSGGIGVGSNLLVIQHLANGDPIGGTGTAKTYTILNSIIRISDAVSNIYFSQVTGSLVVQGCVIDLRGNGAATGSARSVWSKLTSASAVIQNCIFLVDSPKDFTLLGSFLATDTVTMDHNAYVLGSGGLIVQTYNSGASLTFAQWQLLGKDANSLASADLLLSSTYVPAYNSAALAIGGLPSGLTGTYDYRGRPRPSTAANADAGAVQVTGTPQSSGIPGISNIIQVGLSIGL